MLLFVNYIYIYVWLTKFFYMLYWSCNFRPFSYVRWFIGGSNKCIYIYRTTINYSSYWSYVHQLSYQTGAPPSIINSSCLHLSPLSWWASTSASSGDCDDAKLPGRIFLWASWGTGTVAVGYLFMSFLNGNINCHHLFCRLYPCFLSMFFSRTAL